MKRVALLGALIGVLIMLLMPAQVSAFNPQPEPPASETSLPHTINQFDTLFPILDVGPELAQRETLTHDAVGMEAQYNPMRIFKTGPGY